MCLHTYKENSVTLGFWQCNAADFGSKKREHFVTVSFMTSFFFRPANQLVLVATFSRKSQSCFFFFLIVGCALCKSGREMNNYLFFASSCYEGVFHTNSAFSTHFLLTPMALFPAFICYHRCLALLFCFFLLFFSFFLLDERICSPPFMVLDTDCSSDVLEQIKRQGLTFPFSKYSNVFLQQFCVEKKSYSVLN